MSLSLIQGYSSAEEDEAAPEESVEDYQTDEEDDDESSGVAGSGGRSISYKSVFVPSASSTASSALPSAFDAFSEISGPPQFLNNCVDENATAREIDNPQGRHARGKKSKDRNNLPSGVVVEAKAQLVGIHERVRSDIETNQSAASSIPSTGEEEGRRVATAANPNAEDAAELLRMCLQCGIPKSYTSARGMVCPVCGDRPPAEKSVESKKKGSTMKDKEKSKRMKGQSSHATWKSETEMQLRQQFD